MVKIAALVLLCMALATLAKASPSGRVVGGDEAAEGQFPHQISLRYSGSHICGGSIISRNYILTAAHCVGAENEEGQYEKFDPRMISIRAGSNNRLSGGVVVNVAETIVHELYEGVLNDVALLRLEKPLIYSQYIQAIPLATAEVPSGSPVVISGWGRVKTNGDIPLKLKYNTLKAVSKSQCISSLVVDFESLVCLSHSRGNGACNGDSGGPAVYNNELVGVAGFVMGGCGTFMPDGYAKVFYHRQWIIDNSDL